MFKIEAEERLKVMSSGLLELEKATTTERQMIIVESIFREAHSLKGAARAVNLTNVEEICQSLENVFAALKRKAINPSPKFFDTLHHAVDSIGNLLSSPAVGQTSISGLMQQLARLETDGAKGYSRSGDDTLRAQEGVWPDTRENRKHKEENLEKAVESGPGIPTLEGEATYQASSFVEDRPIFSETVRISTAKLDSLFLQAEEMLSVKLAAGQRAADLRDIKVMLDLWDKEWAKIYPTVRMTRQLPEKKDKRNELDQTNSQFVKLLHGPVKVKNKLRTA